MSIQTFTGQENALTQSVPLTETTISLVEWAQELDAAYKLGQAICNTEFAPASFRGNPEATAAAMLTGKALGLDPMNAISNIFIIKGRPSMYARTMQALVLAAGHDVERVSATETQVTVRAKRRGAQAWQEFTWSIDRATRAGYTSNTKYKSDPIGMLTAKALAEACRVVAPDVLTGIAYTREEVELGDFEDLGETDQKPAVAAGVKRMSRKSAKPAEKPVPVPPETGVSVEPEKEKATLAQQRQIAALLKSQGYTSKEQLRQALSDYLERPVTTSSEITKDEAVELISELSTPAPELVQETVVTEDVAEVVDEATGEIQDPVEDPWGQVENVQQKAGAVND